MRNSLPAFLAFLAFGAEASDYLTLSGEQLFNRYCAACHGTEGRGDGPVADALGVEVPDLTALSRRARGVFPRERVIRIIDGRHILGAHGTRTMPVWGEELGRQQLGNPQAERAARIAIGRLADHLESLQRLRREASPE